VASSLTVTVRLFGRYRDLSAASTLDVDVPSRATVADLVAALHAMELDVPLPDRPVVAVNHKPAPDGQALGADDEIALIPPVAGG
jgi:molybdopterin converting factor small subunit